MADPPIDSVVRAIIAEGLDVTPEEISYTMRIDELPEVESLKLLRIMTRIEDRFGIELDDDDVFDVLTVAELCTVVRATIEDTRTEVTT